MSRSTMIAPSILASSRSPVAVNGTSRSKPPVAMRLDGAVGADHDQGAGAAAQDPLQPVAQRGAGRDRGQRRPQAQLLLGPLGHASPEALTRRTQSSADYALSVRRWVRSSSRSAEATSGTSMTFIPSTSRCWPARGPSAGPLGRDHGDPEAQAGRLGQALGQVADPAQLAGQTDLAHGDHAGGRRGVEARARPGRSRRARSLAGSESRAPADRRREHVVAVQAQAAVLGSTASTIATRDAVEPGRRPPRALERRGGDQGLHLGQHRPAALHGDRHAGARDLAGLVLDEQAGRVGDRGDAVGAEVEAADLVDRAEPVLHRADHPEPGVAVALEVQHDVDEVLEHPRPGDRAVLGDVADEHGGDVAGLGHPDQRGRDLLDLGDATGHALDARRRRWSGRSRRPAASGRTCSMWVSTAPRSFSAAR